MNFNRVLRRFRDDLSRPDYAAVLGRLREVVAELHASGLEVREDLGRDWENAHVLLRLAALHAQGARSVLDFGGGNSPVAYYLAKLGCRVTVIETDAAVVARITDNAAALGLGRQLQAVCSIRHQRTPQIWSVPAGSVDVVVSISVFEGLLRSTRPQFWSEVRRVLVPGGALLMTFDFGLGARLVSDPLLDADDVGEQILDASQMELVGEAFAVPEFDPQVGPPVKALVPSVDGYDHRVAEYSFGAVHLRAGPRTGGVSHELPRVDP